MGEEHLVGIEAALAAGAALSEVRLVDNTPVVVVPKGWEARDLSSLLAAPKRIKQSVTFRRLGDFVEYVNRYKDGRLTVWGNAQTQQIKAVLDYHVGMTENTRERPGWCDHVATLEFMSTPAWKMWREMHKHAMSQVQFAEFLEDRLGEIAAPNSAQVLDVVSRLEAYKTAKITSAANTHTGAYTFAYEEEIQSKGKGNFQVPTRLTLELPIYEGDDSLQEVDVRLRYQIDQKGLMFTYEIVRLEEQMRAIFAKRMAEVGVKTSEPVWLGSF